MTSGANGGQLREHRGVAQRARRSHGKTATFGHLLHRRGHKRLSPAAHGVGTRVDGRDSLWNSANSSKISAAKRGVPMKTTRTLLHLDIGVARAGAGGLGLLVGAHGASITSHRIAALEERLAVQVVDLRAAGSGRAGRRPRSPTTRRPNRSTGRGPTAGASTGTGDAGARKGSPRRPPPARRPIPRFLGGSRARWGSSPPPPSQSTSMTTRRLVTPTWGAAMPQP